MNTIILPGYSPKNSEWAQQTQENLQNADIESSIHEWKHWETGNKADFDKKQEAERILEKISDEEVNILAKSVGTLIAMQVVAHAREQINKVILNGIPVKWEKFKEADKSEYGHVSELDTSQVLVIQNESDPFSNYSDIEKLVHQINSDISVISKDSSDHDYPYFEDFISFLSED